MMAKGRDTIREETKKASLSRENLQTTKNLREISLCIKLEWEVIFFFSINGPNSFKTVKNNLYYKKQHFKRRNWYVSITFIHINYFSLFFLNCKKVLWLTPIWLSPGPEIDDWYFDLTQHIGRDILPSLRWVSKYHYLANLDWSLCYIK